MSKFETLAYTNCVVEVAPVRTVVRSNGKTPLRVAPTYPSLDIPRSLLTDLLHDLRD
ncbi:MAG: hypothetical protein J7642_18135 [Cyanobacteria bacterium SBC]|nr:hypothetical protein [Cyanobacteria bacterium SBC]